MNIKELTASISASENIPAGRVMKVVRALAEHMAKAIDSGEKLQLPGLAFIPRTLPAREAQGDRPARPERKLARLRRKPAKGSKA